VSTNSGQGHRDGYPRTPSRPRHDYAVTEVVHCKSKGEHVVAEAQGECVARYLGPILDASGAKVVVVVVVLGARANAALGAWPIGLHGPVDLGGRERLVLCSPHPNTRRKRRRSVLWKLTTEHSKFRRYSF